MIKTKDGKTLKRGECAWEVGVLLLGKGKRKYMPTRGKVHSKANPVLNEDLCWASYDECMKECKKREKKYKKDYL